ncbi:hypothetical protein GP486_004514 [Trichoglossum hirsutum]|uniref:BZIP domain-containing protein n=1 Tax=Trichoglossum hirsutum TaxID=265104 RepID=A0A9P8LB09_9PEZI|nr:hypothetical protein GP486_004514 [Trichoglossum hirsutum]
MASKAPRKRKTSLPIDADHDAAEQRRRDKKRVQNRLSQQCYREKQASYIKQLERFVENVQSAGSGSADIPSQLQEMQKKQLHLMKENQELREAILRMRKKLLSLSTAASTSADDVIFGRILNATTGESLSQDMATASEAQKPYVTNLAAGTIPVQSEISPVTTPDSMTDPLSMDSSNTMSENIHMPSSAPFSIIPPAVTSADDHNRQLAGSAALRFSAPLPNLSAPSIPTTAPLNAPYYPCREGFRLDPADFSDHVLEESEKLIRETMTRMRFGLFREDWSQRAIARQFTTQQIDEVDHMTLTDLCRIAFRIILRASTLEKYVYAGGTVPVLEKILRWRIAPTTENRDAIDEPFRPTPLQQLVRDRHPTIDFIHWGEVRDQLIIYMGAYNMQTVMMDSLQYLVRDVPELNIAIPVVEFYNAITASLDSSDLSSPEPIIPSYNPFVAYNPNSQNVVRRVKKFGLGRVTERKLMPAFVKKYPFLDIPSAVSKLPVVHYADIGPYEYCFPSPKVAESVS